MKVQLDYGQTGMTVELPDHTTVIAPHRRRPLADPAEALRAALRAPIGGPPLRELVEPGGRVAISVCDGTRPQPRIEMLDAIMGELDDAGAGNDVLVLIATGTHTGNSPDELREMLGNDVLGRCEVVNHDCRDAAQLVSLGTVADDVPVALNRAWVEADVRITTGFVEPHFFAGFSGGPKLVAPGLAALETVLALHNARRIADPRATWGVVEGNPVHDAVRAAAALAPPTLAFDVLLNSDKQITDVFAGPLQSMHAKACAVAREVAMVEVPQRFPLVVTTNSGYPLDRNLYQTVKGMSAAAEIVEAGGVIVCASECRDGIPEPGVYAELLRSHDGIDAVAHEILAADEVTPDQWQAQVQARVQDRARVVVKTDGLSRRQLADAHLEPIDDVAAFVQSRLDEDPALPVAVLPSGPQTIAYVA